jgi:Zn finger protein HypA/HybF involved in hydrogenase expression
MRSTGTHPGELREEIVAENETVQPRCPACSGPLVAIGSREVGITEADAHRRHAYWCPAGCRGPEPDGTFEFFDCPACGSHDTSSTRHGNGIEELECHACDTITSIQITPSSS